MFGQIWLSTEIIVKLPKTFTEIILNSVSTRRYFVEPLKNRPGSPENVIQTWRRYVVVIRKITITVKEHIF